MTSVKMKRWAVAAAAGLLLVVLADQDGEGHVIPAQRSILVQMEEDTVAILVTWTSSNTGSGEQLFAEAIAGRKGKRAEASLRAFATARALGPVEIRVDGKPLRPAKIETKVILDPNHTGRLGAAVLVTARLPEKGRQLAVHVSPGCGRTRLAWIDRSHGAVKAANPAKPGTWSTLSELSLIWNDSGTD